MERLLGPLRTGFFYGILAVLATVAINLRFLYLDPAATPAWLLSVCETFLPLLGAAVQIFLGILAAIRVRPNRLDPDVPYRSILLRDCAMAATIVAVMVGTTLLLTTALQATVFADGMRGYASEVSPKIASYVNDYGKALHNPPPETSAAEIEKNLQPPTLQYLGRSISNFVLRALLIGVLGAVVGLIRGWSWQRRDGSDAEPSTASPDVSRTGGTRDS